MMDHGQGSAHGHFPVKKVYPYLPPRSLQNQDLEPNLRIYRYRIRGLDRENKGHE